METFGEYIRKLRINAGLPIRKIAAQLDIDSSLLGRIERNERQANKDIIAGIAKIFNQDEQDLFHQFLSDQIAYKILDEDADIGVLKVADLCLNFVFLLNLLHYSGLNISVYHHLLTHLFHLLYYWECIFFF